MDVYQRLTQLGLEIPELPKPVASYEPAMIHGNLIFSAGQTGTVKQRLVHKGKLGQEVSIEEGKASAELCLLNCLSELEFVLGDLNRINHFIKLTGFVASSKDFGNQPEVVEGASALLLEIFGEKGKHARSALGVAELPYNAPVEIEVIASID
ncbi:RidA family protein [Xylanibacillus composti]|uniref:LysR family transcriptional regulator n=1 Tax=Xylanibacillus composti TaxID=1572762 RepID=A0A8J4H795_9BACL|nr:RidA family protein [Xylanibacillus composti]MDT9726942.1 RidA family protein [Xylanibacillus composti]GIQ70088.1 LysR family transcriptional regulator [Xylanibacillus composti]